MPKRHYRNNLKFIESGYRACWLNTQDLVLGAKALLDASQHALALSVAVLALEELGKLFCLDGLLFARTDDGRAATFASSLKSHRTKLSALELLPLLMHNIAMADPRYGVEQRFNQAIALSATDLKARGNAVLSLLPEASFVDLDAWKQAGFYAQPRDNSFLRPRDAVAPDISQTVYLLAWRASTTLDFLLKDGNLERYIAAARNLRSSMSEADHQALSEVAEELSEQLFSTEVASEESSDLNRGHDA